MLGNSFDLVQQLSRLYDSLRTFMSIYVTTHRHTHAVYCFVEHTGFLYTICL